MISDIECSIDRNSASFTDANGRDYWFSYKTLIAFQSNGERIVRRNDWSQTTGKHLNAIDGGDKDAKAVRLSEEDFKAALAKMLLA